jgi:hypothetical protein
MTVINKMVSPDNRPSGVHVISCCNPFLDSFIRFCGIVTSILYLLVRLIAHLITLLTLWMVPILLSGYRQRSTKELAVLKITVFL